LLPLVTLDPSIITTETAKAVVNELKRKKEKEKEKKKEKDGNGDRSVHSKMTAGRDRKW
jgi:hypothetical protein